MSQNTAIEWATDTVNFWWGCSKVSEACRHCYAETLALRWRRKEVEWQPGGARMLREKAFVEADKLRRMGGRRVFVNSMSDSFEDHPGLDVQRAAMLHALALADGAQWLLLTKRPENVRRFVPWSWLNGSWPRHVWIGTTVEDQATADPRIRHLLGVPAVVRFLSVEPMLGEVDLSPWLDDSTGVPRDLPFHWVICGGESGPKARPMNPDWARALRDQCSAAGVPFFFKQWGGRTPKAGGRELDGREWNEVPA